MRLFVLTAICYLDAHPCRLVHIRYYSRSRRGGAALRVSLVLLMPVARRFILLAIVLMSIPVRELFRLALLHAIRLAT